MKQTEPVITLVPDQNIIQVVQYIVQEQCDDIFVNVPYREMNLKKKKEKEKKKLVLFCDFAHLYNEKVQTEN